MLSELGVCTGVYHSWPLDRALQGIKSAGFTRVELCTETSCRHADPEEFDEKSVKELLKKVADYGLTLTSDCRTHQLA